MLVRILLVRVPRLLPGLIDAGLIGAVLAGTVLATTELLWSIGILIGRITGLRCARPGIGRAVLLTGRVLGRGVLPGRGLRILALGVLPLGVLPLGVTALRKLPLRVLPLWVLALGVTTLRKL